MIRHNELIHHGIPGMKWGIRRYQNADGTLTAAGKKRYEQDLKSNGQKKAKDRAEPDSLKDPNRWVREDLENAKKASESSSELVKKMKEIEKGTRPKPKAIDLTSMTDQELRQSINRKLMEKQYNDLFGKPEISKGRMIVENTLKIAGDVAALGTSALSIALAVKNLSK